MDDGLEQSGQILTETAAGVWVVIAAFNEESTISKVLDDLAAYPYQVVVVDDGSRDQTARIVLKHRATLLQHITNLGQGAALQTGITYACRMPDCQVIVTFDADGQHLASEIGGLIEPIIGGRADVTLGSRFVKGGKALDIPRTRYWMLRLATWFSRLTTGLHTTDTHNGLRAFRVGAARQIHITQNRMAHATEILSQVHQAGLRFVEVPVTIHYTEYSLKKGQSVLEFFNVLWDMFSGRFK